MQYSLALAFVDINVYASSSLGSIIAFSVCDEF